MPGTYIDGTNTMGNGMNKVLSGLYLGSFRDGKDPEQLKVNNISHIISIHDNAREVVEDKEYLCIRVSDSPDENLSRYFPRCNDFIHNARLHGGNVLIHCLAGVSRSATIAAAYIMSVTSLSSKDALKVVRGARNIANPNYGFQSQLKEYEFHALSEERKRLHGKYPDRSSKKEDEEDCAKMIRLYHHSNTKPAEVPGISGRSPFHSPRHRLPSRNPGVSSTPQGSPQRRTFVRTPTGSPKRS